MAYDVIVVGAKRVLLLEKAQREKRGGNTHFSGAVLRFKYDDLSELDRFVPHAERDYAGFHKGVHA